MNEKYVISINVEVLMEAYSDILASLLRFLETNHMSLEEKDNVWVRMFFLLRDQKEHLLEIETWEDAGKAEGMYLLAKKLLEGEKKLMK